MKPVITTLTEQRKNIRPIVAALLMAGAVGGWATSTMFAANPAAVEGLSPFDTMPKSDMRKLSSEQEPATRARQARDRLRGSTERCAA